MEYLEKMRELEKFYIKTILSKHLEIIETLLPGQTYITDKSEKGINNLLFYLQAHLNPEVYLLSRIRPTTLKVQRTKEEERRQFNHV